MPKELKPLDVLEELLEWLDEWTEGRRDWDPAMWERVKQLRDIFDDPHTPWRKDPFPMGDTVTYLEIARICLTHYRQTDIGPQLDLDDDEMIRLAVQLDANLKGEA
jgi:hypothetical protein